MTLQLVVKVSNMKRKQDMMPQSGCVGIVWKMGYLYLNSIVTQQTLSVVKISWQS
jgi:hypothetical protein